MLLALGLSLATIAPAGASVWWMEGITVTGNPTQVETMIIGGAWNVLQGGLGDATDCLEPLTIQVVDRAEDFFSSGNFAIASFYRPEPEPIIFIEHGKVTPENLVHEFAHHLDLSCGIGGSDVGATFQEAAGFDPAHDWYYGRSWTDVPAEHFAEAILSYLGVGELQIDVTNEAIAVVVDMATPQQSSHLASRIARWGSAHLM